MSEPVVEHNSDLPQHLSEHNQVQVMGYAHDGIEAAQMALHLRPDVLLVEEKIAGLSGPEVCRLVSQAAPGVPCALISDKVDPISLQAAMNSGARAVFTPAEEVSEVVKVLHRLAEFAKITSSSEYARITDPAQMPATLVGAAAKEGLGTTTIMANLAVLLAQGNPEDTVLVDWHLQLSDIAAVLGLRPKHAISDFAAYGEQIDPEVVDTCLTRHGSGLYVLPGMVAPRKAWLQPLSRTFTAQLLGILRRRFRYILCDLPTVLGPAEIYLCKHCQVLLLISTLADASTLRATVTLTDLLEAQEVPPQHLHLILSRTERASPFRPEELEELTNFSVQAQVPEDSNVARVAQAGEPVVTSSSRSPASVALKALAESVESWLPTGPEISTTQTSPAPAPSIQ